MISIISNRDHQFLFISFPIEKLAPKRKKSFYKINFLTTQLITHKTVVLQTKKLV